MCELFRNNWYYSMKYYHEWVLEALYTNLIRLKFIMSKLSRNTWYTDLIWLFLWNIVTSELYRNTFYANLIFCCPGICTSNMWQWQYNYINWANLLSIPKHMPILFLFSAHNNSIYHIYVSYINKGHICTCCNFWIHS